MELRCGPSQHLEVDRVFGRTAIGVEGPVGDTAGVGVAEGLVEIAGTARAFAGVEEEEADGALACLPLELAHDPRRDAAATMRRQHDDFAHFGAVPAVAVRLK